MIIKAFEKVDPTVEANLNPRGAFVACLMRTSGHDWLDFDVTASDAESGGSDGCIDLDDPAHFGIDTCLIEFGIPEVFD